MSKHLLVLLSLIITILSSCKNESRELPNILWLTSEDNSPMLGCYGDEFATTPNLDKLAGEGFLYTNAYANAPVCAPARNTILTGVHACSNGNEHMRSFYRKSEIVRSYAEYLREKGYYCTNNWKTDYNYSGAENESMWDECGDKAHYLNREEGQPFFAVFNSMTSHESRLHISTPDSLLRHNPAEVILPPYHPDIPEMRHDRAQYYDKIEDMDAEIGQWLAELEEAGLAENTIVFYYGDHGGVLPRSKRFIYETGTRVPLIIRIPEKYKKMFPAGSAGMEVNRLVSFVDLAPTLLSMAGIEAPEYMQGSAFLGKYKAKAPEYVYLFRDRMDEKYDLSRAVTDGKFRYIRNFNSNREHLQYISFLWRAPSMAAWEREYREGRCNDLQSAYFRNKPVEELYDTDNDPWEVNNLAGDPAWSGELERMRKALKDKAKEILDAGFIPEADRDLRAGNDAIYDMIRKPGFPWQEIFDAAWLASESDPVNADALAGLTESDDAAIPYWGVHGLLLIGEGQPQLAEVYHKRIAALAFDSSLNVSTTAAELLYIMGDKETALKSYSRVLKSEQMMARLHALNSIDHIGGSAEMFLEPCLNVLNPPADAEKEFPGALGCLSYFDHFRADRYDLENLKGLMRKWGVDPGEHGL